jgi:hypothetical protein
MVDDLMQDRGSGLWRELARKRRSAPWGVEKTARVSFAGFASFAFLQASEPRLVLRSLR